MNCLFLLLLLLLSIIFIHADEYTSTNNNTSNIFGVTPPIYYTWNGIFDIGTGFYASCLGNKYIYIYTL